MLPLQIGRICWAIPPGDRGEGKLRPVIVISRSFDTTMNAMVFVVVCSTDFHHPPKDDEIEIPSSKSEFSVTKLTKPTVAVCNWTATIPCDQISYTSGMVPGPILRKVFAVAGIPFVSQR